MIAEIVWTLESFYELPKEDIANKIAMILNTPHLTCPEAALIRRALDLYSPGSILKPITFGERKQDPTQAVSI